MSDQWNFYALLVDDEPASIFVDLGVAKEAPIADLPNMAYLRVRMNNPRPDGLSSQEEYDELIKIENDVALAVESHGKSLYVGRNTSSGNRDFYFYTRGQSIEEAFKNAMENWPKYNFQTGVRPDAEWPTYWRFLHPSQENLQLMGNRDVVDHLLENGDRIETPRKIDYFAVFKTPHDRKAFTQHLVTKGYAISQTRDADGEFQIEFDRIDRPDEIDDVAIDLYRTARDNDGDYDGWGCVTAN